MKKIKRFLALVLVICMTLCNINLNAFATEITNTIEETAEISDTTSFNKILHLDAGRKYFTKDWIIALINEMSAAGYTQLQLAFGNDGLRFLLDDMSVTVNGTNYSDADVTEGIQLGNKNYYDAGDVNELTETEMDAIIAHAKTKEIEIVPHMNMPGHMDAILDAIEYVGISDAHFTGYTTSTRSLNLNNDTAIAFTQALLEKYVTYFAGKGCSYFHIGADEFANDAYNGSMGFAVMGSTLYGKFVTFVQNCATIVKDASMTPRAWNDGFYYGSYTTNIDTDIQLTYWSSGWGSGYDLESAVSLADYGHDMINTNGDYYYILGANDCYTSGETTTHVGYDYTAAESFSNTTFMGSTVSNPVGSMFCIWADNPGAETETEVAKYVRPILRVMGARMQDSDDYEVESVVSGGFNADGTINEELGTLTTLISNDVSVSAYNLTGFTATLLSSNPVIDGAEKVMTWDMVPENADGKYTGEATVKFPVPAEWNSNKVFAFVVNNDDTITMLNGTYDSGYYTVTMPHFSEGGIYEATVTAEGVDTVVTSSGTSTSYVLDTDGLDVDAQYLIVYDGNALTNTKGSLDVTVNGNNATPSGDASAALWTYSATTYGTYTYNQKLSNGSNYLYTSVTGNWYDRQYKLNIDSSENTLTITNNNDGTYTIYRSNYGNYAYVNYTTDDGWGASSSSQNLSFYKYTAGTQTFTVDAALQESRIASLTVSNDSYTDETWEAYESALTAAQAKLIAVEGATYNSESAANTALTELIAAVDALETTKNALAKAVTITINYVDADSKTVKTETKNVAENVTSVTLTSPIYDDESNCYTLENTNLALNLVTTTIYTVNVTYVAEDLSQVESLEIEYWQTNGQVVESIGSSVNSKTITAESAYSEDGIELITIIPQSAYKATAEEGAAALTYWRCRLLPWATNEQTDASGDDETLNGVGFTKVRYWNGSWAVYNENNEWQNIDSDTYQLVAYYMNNMNLANEVSVGTSDWGKKGNGDLASEYLGSDNVSIAFQVVYEDGTTAPAGTDAASLAAYSYLVDNWNPRGVGTIALNQIGDYQIWKVTAETGTHTTDYNNSAFTSVNITNFTWDDNEMTVWEGEPTSQYTILNPANNPSTEGAYANLTWDETNESILIRIYIKTVETEDSLTVIYYDEKFGDTLYSYNISVEKDVTFADITPTPSAFASNAERINVSGCTIKNALGVNQQFQTDLTQVPQAVGKYNSELYKYTGSEISEDGKTLYLYYSIDTEVLSPMFVVDYGNPFTFDLSKVVGDNQETLVEDVTVNKNTRYGTLEYNATKKIFTYTPTQVLPNIDVLTINIKFTTEATYTTTNAGVMPATTVDYEEGFAALTGFTGGGKGTSLQTAQVAGQSSDEYGHDNNIITAENTAAVSNAKGSTAIFTFTGTGMDLYVNSTETSGNIAIQVRDASNSLVKVISVQTTSNSTITDNFSNTNQNGLIAASVRELTYGTYTVKVTTTNDADVYFDGFRIYGTLQDQNNAYYVNDLEDNPTFLELRDYVLTSMNVTNSDSASVYAQIREATEGTLTSAVLSSDISYDGQALLENGPKNELFLLPGQSVVFKLTTEREVQVGLKAVNGTANVTGNYEGEISTEKDMFYTVLAKSENGEKTVTITNDETSTSILSVTKVKICDDPNVAFAELNAEDLVSALETLGFIDEPTYADALLNINISDTAGNILATTQLTENGIVGETATFNASDIEAAVTALELPENYELETAVYEDTAVLYGEEATVSFTAEEVVEPEEPETENTITEIINKVMNSFKNFLNKIFGW